ncbi:TPA: MFS transporter, partial [Candidatus Gastranaerophilales bacterium HUM_6]
RAALAYGSFFALWSCLAFRMKQEPFFASDDIIGALGLCGLAGASTVVFISGYVQKYGARFFSIAGGCVVLAAWILAFLGNDSYLWIIIAILLIDAGMQCIHLSNQTSVVALDASAINRINTVYMTIYFGGGSAGTFVSGLSWQHYGWTGVVGVGIAFTVASLLVNCFKPQRHKGGY